jgi:hypothetical protein
MRGGLVGGLPVAALALAPPGAGAVRALRRRWKALTARQKALVVVPLAALALIGGCVGPYQFWWSWKSPCVYCWVQRDVAHN